MTDLISRADAIEAVEQAILNHDSAIMRITALPSADANPTVVRCKTMIPYGDFREWAKRIREDNPNVIVIPFDAEVASADAEQGEWIKWTETKEDDTGVTYIPHWKCSVCDTEYDPYFANRINVCPNCGARMKGGAE